MFLGLSASELRVYRYQSTRTRTPVYSIGDHYYAIAPGPDGWDWEAIGELYGKTIVRSKP